MAINESTYLLDKPGYRLIVGRLTDNKAHLHEEEISELSLIPNLQRQKEYITVRGLLRYAGITDIISYDEKKPVLKNRYISISHCKTHAIVALSKQICGVDIEIISGRAFKVRDKFLNEQEKLIAGDDNFLNSLFWSAKECLYKLNNLLKDFRKDMHILSVNEHLSSLSVKTGDKQREVNYMKYEGMVICWI